MKIPIPQEYSYKYIADVENDILHIHQLLSFERLMYDLTYATNDVKECYYCSKPLNRRESTLDHIYPRDLGGPSIPNNLCFCCRKCNLVKDNMTEEEFKDYLSLTKPSDKKKYIQHIANTRDSIKKSELLCLPTNWVVYLKTDKIISSARKFETTIDSYNYKKIEKKYNKYGHIYRPIILDKNLKLLDGFKTLLYAQKHGITQVPVIILENVELD